MSLFIPMAHLGFIIVPNVYTHEKVVQGHRTPYGSSSTAGQNSAKPTADELVVAKHQGARVTQVAAALKAATVGLIIRAENAFVEQGCTLRGPRNDA